MADETLTRQEEASINVEVAASTGTPAPVKKVELDLDDAPFLQAEEKAPEPPAYGDGLENVASGNADDEAARKKKKRMLLAAAAAALLALGVAVWWFFFRAPPPLPPDGPEPEVIVVPSAPAATEKPDLVREFEPFVVPGRDAEGRWRFLICKFSAITKDPAVHKEMEQRMLALRDAIYYYLRLKDDAFLLNARNGAEIKRDLLSVFSDYLSQGKLEDIVFESYLSK